MTEPAAQLSFASDLLRALRSSFLFKAVTASGVKSMMAASVAAIEIPNVLLLSVDLAAYDALIAEVGT